MSRSEGTTTPTDRNIQIIDVTTNNVSSSKHGFVPKSTGVSTQYLDGTGNYSTPSSGNILTIGQSLMLIKGNYTL